VILQPGWDPLFVEGDCYRADELAPRAGEPAPRHGQHLREIAGQLLGLDGEEIDRLIAAGVLEDDST
jgi:crotonobetainyl-CoA:carnitine CoA-transferase CaiB-like acyl-CoA transferase